MIGKTLSHYRIASKLGEGGMGEVYLAEDTRLERKVALKVLPSDAAADPDRLVRFEREAKTVSQLSHPHICTLYDVGKEGGVEFLVMEYLEGETLAERLERRPVPLDEAVGYAVQIADALDTAHRQGVVHRDLKPANIMLTRDGSKLLDFGLAKLQPARADIGESALATEDRPLTQEGSILGTFRYMAPEQLEGKEVDARTDIFAFGAVVYEMLTGRKAFEGTSQASLIAAILEHDPPALTELVPVVPSALDRLVKKCLAKHPDSRWQTATDLADELRWVFDDSSQPGVAAPTVARRTSRDRLAWAAAGLALGALVAGIAVRTAVRQPPARPPTVQRFTVEPPVADSPIRMRLPVVSPDGRHLVFVGKDVAGGSRLYLRSMDELEAQPLAGTEGAFSATFSPDGESLAFITEPEHKLKKVPILGGAPRTLAEPSVGAASWGDDGHIYYSPSYPIASGGDPETHGLWRVPASGGPPEAVTTPDSEANEQSEAHAFPEVLPRSEAVLFTVATSRDPSAWNIAALSLKTGQLTTLISGGMIPRYAASGHLVFFKQGELWAAPFDPIRLQTTGSPVPVERGLMLHPEIPFGVGQYCLSETGSLVYVASVSGVFRDSTLVWVDRQGQTRPVTRERQSYWSPRFSPDGRRLAVHIGQTVGAQRDTQLWILELDTGSWNRLTYEGSINALPVWSPDGRWVAFMSNREEMGVFRKPADGGGTAEGLITGILQPNTWSPDGRFLVSGGGDLWTLDLADGKATPFLTTPAAEVGAAFSPDGRWIAYASDDAGGEFQVFVRPYPGPGEQQQVSSKGGTEPVWSPDGLGLFYRSGDRMMRVPVETEPTFRKGRPEVLFEGRYAVNEIVPGLRFYDVSPDGQGFVMVQRGEPQEEAQLVLVQNWFEELKRIVPTDEN
jgi:Tol biopolymer transport system component/predicted Ser/Thr protein kinase